MTTPTTETEEEQVVTGYFVRTQTAEGRWVNRDIARLNDEQLAFFFDRKDAAASRRWAASLAAWIRDSVA